MSIQLLLVDDERDVTDLLSRRLQKRGYLCAVAASGAEAVDCVTNSAPHIVIMDVKMPEMDGLEALRRIQTLCPGLPIILLSGHADMETAVAAMESGAFGYLMKPVDFDELLFKIEDACAQRSFDV